ncbi:hypothetical protein [Tsukamurella spumae]|uniref:Uncharacterized protein n=1 Tax=Tsukamurella spumae TaxID=44753 RepID=A0A846X6B8_9ACTN|nr:hypothetical protein [Tsukamurella spumae]NKY21014.1 hypothetical protein [Tsukamurella spumae]
MDTDFTPLEPLSGAQTRSLRDTVERVCLARGLACTPHGRDAYLIGDAICGLANLASRVARVDEDDWYEEVHQWLANLDRIRQVRASEVTAENIYPRLTRSVDTADPDVNYPVEGLIPGLSMIFAADYPTHVSELPAASLFAHLGDTLNVGRMAVNNLHRLPVPAADFVDLEIDGSNNPVIAFEFDDFFAPSRLLYAGTFAKEHLAPSEHGFLVAAPTRDVLLFLPVDGDNILNQVNVFASTVDNLYTGGPGATCELTYHLTPNGGIDFVACVTNEGELYFRPNDYLSAKFFHLPEAGA